MKHKGKMPTDHKGNKFTSNIEMCEYWGINVNTFYSRIRYGYSLEDSLNSKEKFNKGHASSCVDHTGREFPSIREMCEYWNVPVSTYTYRIHSGKSTEYSLTAHDVHNTGSSIPCVDHNGNKFNSILEMCNYHGVNVCTFRHRMKSGKSLKESLEAGNN